MIFQTDLNAQRNASYESSITNLEKAQRLLETIYPSQPWATEFIIKSKDEPNFVKGMQLKSKISKIRDETFHFIEYKKSKNGNYVVNKDILIKLQDEIFYF